MNFTPGYQVGKITEDAVREVGQGIFLVIAGEFLENTVYPNYIVNTYKTAYTYEYAISFAGKKQHEYKGKTEGKSISYLSEFETQNLNDGLSFYFKVDNDSIPIVKEIKIKPASFFQKGKYLEMMQAQCHVYEIANNKTLNTEKIVLDVTDIKKIIRSEKNKPVLKHFSLSNIKDRVVDLHIEALLDSFSKMSNAEILNYQMSVFEKELYKAMYEEAEKLTVIHGVGKGILKENIHAFLDKQDGVKSYKNEYHSKYGFGATFVFFE